MNEGWAAVPPFIYGTAWKEHDTQRCVEQAVDVGFRGIDTAGQPRHYHEPGIGDALDAIYARGELTRGDLFLQSKFTPLGGQGRTIPYDPDAPIREQVHQSFARSLANLRAERLDAYVLHGPSSRSTLTSADWEAWRAMEGIHRDAKARYLGASNMSIDQLRMLCDEADITPAFVQNRCFARTAWDREIRAYCRDHGIVYQGFSLLTANRDVLGHPKFAELVQRNSVTPAQAIFVFARQVGILPLTGTTDRAHMEEDLASLALELPPEDAGLIETLAV